MKRELKRRFLLDQYRQYIFLQFHNLKRGDLSVEDYTMEFEHLMLKCDVTEPEEQTIARFIGGLKTEVGNLVRLQPYWSFNDFRKLALNVESQVKEAKKSGFKGGMGAGSLNENTKPSNFESKQPIKPTDPKPFTKGEGEGSSRPGDGEKQKNTRRCFKCQGFGHIASDCPNRKVFTIMEVTEEGQYEESKPIYDDEEEVT